MTESLYVHSLFASISGEAGYFAQGSWCTFVRLQGCNLSCNYCDTLEARSKPSAEKTLHTSVSFVISSCRTKQILITGGEPLTQEATLDLIGTLCNNGHAVQVETNGSIALPTKYIPPAYWIIDRKGPSSGVSVHMVEQPWRLNTIMVKYVISNIFPHNHDDIQFILDDISFLQSQGYKGKFIISAVNAEKGTMAKSIEFLTKAVRTTMVERMIFSLQMHKLIGMA